MSSAAPLQPGAVAATGTTTASKPGDASLLARYAAWCLLVCGGLEWLLGRTVSRLAAAPTLEGTPRTIIEVVGRVGIYLLAPSFLLAVLLLFLSLLDFGPKANARREPGDLALALFLAVFCVFAATHAFLSDALWLNITFNVLSAAVIWWLALRFAFRREDRVSLRVAALLVALAYSGWYYYVLQQDLVKLDIVPGADPTFVLALGEVVAILAPAAFFVAVAGSGDRWRAWKRWIAPLLLAIAFSGGNIADMATNQGFTGVFTTWSLGLNLVVPWPFYAASLALFSYAVLTCFASGNKGSADRNLALALVLLLFAGYNLQLPYQHLVAVLSLLLATRLATPLDAPREAVLTT